MTRFISIFILYISLVGNSLAQEISSPEQIAFDFFTENILKKNLEDSDKIILLKNVVDECSKFTLSRDCFKRDTLYQRLSRNCREENFNEPIELLIAPELSKNSRVVIRKKGSPNIRADKLFIYVKRKNTLSNKSYVEIVFNKRYHYFQYFFEIDEKENVLDWCVLGRT